MTTNDKVDLLVIQTGLFPDTQTVEGALSALGALRIVREAVDSGAMQATDWDRLVQRIRQADKVVTL